MKLKINDSYEEVDLWSFVKCQLIGIAVILGSAFLFLFCLGFLVGFLGG